MSVTVLTNIVKHGRALCRVAQSIPPKHGKSKLTHRQSSVTLRPSFDKDTRRAVCRATLALTRTDMPELAPLIGRILTRVTRRLRLAVPALMIVAAISLPAMAAEPRQKRVALVIGNAQYGSLPKLKNPANDMREVANTLRAAQFEVFEGQDLTRIDFEELLKSFLRSVENADVSLVYYSGHGIQIAGKNYLVPVDARLATPYDVEIESVNVDNIYGYLRENSKMQLIFLDACRDNPFRAEQYWIADRLEKAPKIAGLAAPTNLGTPSRRGIGMGSLFAFSTEPDKVAYDGTGELSHYTQAFVKRALIPNTEVRQMLTQVRRDVITSTDGRQVPWENSSLLTDFFMVRLPSAPVSQPIHRATVLAGTPGPLDVPAPVSPAGSPLTITFDTMPQKGRLLLAGQPIGPARALKVADLARLAYDPAEAPPGHVELLTYTVTDAWKQAAQGAVAVAVGDGGLVARSSGAAAPAARAPRHPEAHAYLTGLARLTPRPPVGVGGASLDLPAARLEQAGALSVTFTAVPPTGALYAQGKRIEAGTALPLAELAGLSYEPKIGTEDSAFVARLALDTGDRTTEARLAISPALHPCDSETAEPFDLQGVARKGRLPNEINAPAALRACTQAVERFPTVARFRYQLGRAKFAARDIEGGWRETETAAAMGHTRALYQLGYLHRLGIGRPAAPEKAVEYFRQGAERGDPYGIYDYGKAQFYGRGTAKDVSGGLRMMLRAADMGHTYAMNELGYIFLEGIEVQKDTERGLRFYRAGAARQDIYSMNNLGLAHLAGNGVPRDPRIAADYFRKAAEGGQPYAPTNLGRLYRDGAGVPRNLDQAATLFARGAERGDYWGALDRARLAMDGPGKLRSLTDAGYFLALAAAINRPGAGDPENRARRMLADLPAAEKQKVAQRLARELGPQALAGADSSDDRLIALAREAWEKRNPRIDLF